MFNLELLPSTDKNFRKSCHSLFNFPVKMIAYFLLSVFAIFIIFYTIILNYLMKKRDILRYPAGPIGLPIVGNLHQIRKRPEQQFLKWAQKFGNIFSLRFGYHRVVVLNNHKDIRDAFSNPAFCGRPKFHPRAAFSGIFFNAGQSWKEQRSLVFKVLRDQGYGQSTVETLIQSEIDNFLEVLTSMIGKSVDTKNLFLLPIINTIWPLAVGKRLDPEDSVVKALLQEFIDEFITPLEEPRTGVIRYFPTLFLLKTRMSTLFRTKDKRIETINKAQNYFTNIIKEHEQTLDMDGKSRDLVDEFIRQIKLTTHKESSMFQRKGYANLVRNLREILLGVGDTGARALHWLCLLVAMHSNVQDKMQNEIDSVLGKDIPTLQDKERLPYTQAVIMEVLRFSSFLPFAFYHATTEDTTFRGFDIPKDTIVIPNLYAAMHDPKEWKKPETFIPERFLSEDGAKIMKPEAFVPFSAGRRQCPGMPHALDTLFLFTTRIFQKFSVQPAGEEILSTKYTGAILLTPVPFTVKFYDRDANEE